MVGCRRTRATAPGSRPALGRLLRTACASGPGSGPAAGPRPPAGRARPPGRCTGTPAGLRSAGPRRAPDGDRASCPTACRTVPGPRATPRRPARAAAGRRRPRLARSGRSRAGRPGPCADGGQAPRVLVGEVWLEDPERFARYLRPDEMHTAFNFDFMARPWDAKELRQSIETTLDAHRAIGAPPTWVLSNHDVTRPVTRYGRTDTGFAFSAKR